MHEHGLAFGGAEYDWGAIKGVEVYDSPFDPLAWFSFAGGRHPTATAYLKDGLKTPSEIRKLGGAIFSDRRYDHVFVYHSGAPSYYGVRGFRGSLSV